MIYKPLTITVEVHRLQALAQTILHMVYPIIKSFAILFQFIKRQSPRYTF